MRKILWISGIAILLIGLAVLANLPKPVPVEVAVVERGAMEVTVESEGVTRVRDLFLVAAPTSGRLDRIELEEGELIGSGVGVATIYPAPINPAQKAELEAQISAIESSRGSAQAQVDALESQLRQAEKDRGRLQDLLDQGAIPRRQVEEAELAVETLEDQIGAARNNVRAAEEQVKAAKAGRATYGDNTAGVAVKAPSGGTVLRVFEKSERVVMAGTPLVAIGDPKGLEIVVDILSSDAVRVEPGDRIIVEGWGGDRKLEGIVRYLEPSAFTKISALGIQEQRVNVIGMFSEYPDKLGDGYRVVARIVTWQGPNVLKIPLNALFREGEEWAVFVVENGEARTRIVTIDHRNEFEVEITGGLEEGEEVILHPSNRLSEGSSVET